MPDYDFHQLSPYDLEILARDLLQAHWGVNIESFKTGRDGGIDLRYARGSDKTIVQVKHYLRTGLTGLLRDLRGEGPKVRRLQQTRYLLVTSVPLSPYNKSQLCEVIGNEILKPGDILGQEDLNNLLSQYPAIEGQHYKLWLASRAVLDRVIHNAAVTRSEFKARQVHAEAKRYVPSNAYPQALAMLNEQRVVIIAGPPGVGKSTLANLLLYEHLEKGYQAVLVQRDVDEGANLFQPGVPQVFYFDDFMGATFLGEGSAGLASTNDRTLLQFIAMVRATPTARLILTTREHIYSQAMDRSERLRHSDLDDLRVLLRIPSYSFAQKARILYNHLYFSDLPSQHRDELLRGDFYMHIIKHEKFNPRLIEWLSSYRRIRAIPIDRYRAFVVNLLRDPSEIWRHAYEQEITNAARSLLLALFSAGGKTTGAALRTAFASLHGERAARYGFQSRPEDFRSALREAAGAFIKPSGTHSIAVVDPSVLDLLNAVVSAAPDNAVDMMAAAVSFDQIERLWSFAKAENSGSVMAAMRRDADRLSCTVRIRMNKDRRVALGKGAFGYSGVTFERRLALVVEMAERLPSPAFASLIEPLFGRLKQEWGAERPEINDAIDLIRALEQAQAIPSNDLARMSHSIRAAILAEASTGCRSDELRELIGVIDTSNPSGPAVVSARSGFENYRRSLFSDELRDCRSSEQFDALIEDLELFRDTLGVDITSLLERVEDAKADFESDENAHADHMQDEWKERWRNERASERSISDMFGSLGGDRD